MPDIAQIQSHDANISTAKLPLIDVSPYLDPISSLEARQTAAKELDKACRDFGK
jgi:isopenicillin N synthase-like dioxygenase